jgi:hypothetical protein
VAYEIFVPLNERSARGLIRWLPNIIGNVDGKEVAWCEEAIHGVKTNMVCIAEIWVFPRKTLHSRICGGARFARTGVDNHVLAIGFIPYRYNVYSGGLCKDARLQLSDRLVRKAIAYANGVLVQKNLRCIHHRAPVPL